MLDLTAALSLIPYLLVAGKSYVPDVAIATVATVYTLFLVYAAGVDKLLLSCILYAPAAALYFKARRERRLRVFRPAEAVRRDCPRRRCRCGIAGNWAYRDLAAHSGKGADDDQSVRELRRAFRGRQAAQGVGVLTGSGS